MYTGLLEIVTELLLIRPDVDDALIAANGEIKREEKKDEDDEDATVSMSQMASFRDLIVRGPINNVESFDGFVRSVIDQVRSGKYYKNYLDLDNLQVTSDYTIRSAAFDAQIR